MPPSSQLAIASLASLTLGVFIGEYLTKLRRRRRPAPRRYGAAIQLRRESYRKYRELHDAVWEDVLRIMERANIRNFTIYYHEETGTMFQHFEWIGHWKQPGCDESALFAENMTLIASDPTTLQWWKLCEPCQKPFAQWKEGEAPPSQGGTGNWWAPLECVNHCGHWPTEFSLENRDPDFVTMKP